MNSIVRPVVLASSLALASVSLFGQAPAAGTVAEAGGKKLVRIATINGAAAVQGFQRNVQLVQAQRQAAAQLKADLDKETDPKKKKDLQSKLDAAFKKLEENNAAMVKNYGFSILRNYILEIDRANIYMEVTDEEAAKLDQAQKDLAKKGKK